MFIRLIWTVGDVERQMVLEDEDQGAMLEGTALVCSQPKVRKQHGRTETDRDELRDPSGRGSSQRHPEYES